MPSYPFLFLGCIVGAGIGYLILKKDRPTIFLGIATGLALVFAFAGESSWYLLAVPVFAGLMVLRRKKVIQGHSTT